MPILAIILDQICQDSLSMQQFYARRIMIREINTVRNEEMWMLSKDKYVFMLILLSKEKPKVVSDTISAQDN